jgi:polynucleotide 5'-hydroxyl-kinase GRC3/NOL9
MVGDCALSTPREVSPTALIDGKVEAVAVCKEQPRWRAALAELEGARSIILLGATDTGKTTFLAWLAATLQAQGRRMAIVDADVGQSSLGPPTTIGLGIVVRPVHSLQELTPVALHFVGSTTPRGHLVPMLVGTKRMVDRAQTLAVDGVIIDTCGFISAQGGQILKHAQIAMVNPDVVVCFQRRHECEGILAAYRYRQRPRILRFQAAHACRRRSLEERRFHREQTLRRYFANPRVATLSWDDLNLVDTPLWSGAAFDVAHATRHERPSLPEILWAERCDSELRIVTEAPLPLDTIAELERATGMRLQTWLAEELHGTLVGLLDEAGDALGVGVLQRIHFARRHIEILTAGDIEGIIGIQWSRTRIGPGGTLQRVPSSAV